MNYKDEIAELMLNATFLLNDISTLEEELKRAKVKPTSIEVWDKIKALKIACKSLQVRINNEVAK